MSSTTPNPNSCGCGVPDRTATPVSLFNRPGLSTLAYRVGTHGQFKQAMHNGLSARPELNGLTTRYDTDPTLALLDGWATALDVLTFYQERIANEGFLRTATERRSVLELARAIGYELGPGVAAGTHLAFTLDRPVTTASQAIQASTPTEIVLPAGTRAQSIPGPGELPQVFETVEQVTLRADWNALTPRTGRRRNPAFGDTHLYLAGTSTLLKPGDAILIIGGERDADTGSERWDFRRLLTVEPDPARAITRVTWAEGLGWARFGRITLPAGTDPRVYALRTRAAIFGHNAQDWPGLADSLKADYLGIDEAALTSDQRLQWPGFSVFAPVFPLELLPSASVKSARSSRAKAKAKATVDPLIASAPTEAIVVAAATAATVDSTPRGFPKRTTDSIDLDTVYPAIGTEGWVVLTKPNLTEVFQVASALEISRAEYLLSGKVTRLKLSRAGKLLGEHLDQFADALRDTTVFAQSEPLALADTPITDPVEGSLLELSTLVEGLEEGRSIALSGTDAITGERIGEVVTLDRTETVDGITRLVFTTSLQRSYLRENLLIMANVARATHGETRIEVLGSGDGSQTFQAFTLKFAPLTHVSAATPRGIATTLEIRVDGVRWEEVDSLHAQGPEARVYVTRRDDDGNVTLRFGDGITGARLPTGQDNVTATYRVGIGTAALVKAGQISLLMSRPLGLKEVVNPAAPTGADDPESLDAAKSNAPLTVLTLDRIVSLQDHEDFARAFAGIAKARATLLWNGEQRLVHLTLAGVDGAAVDPASDLYRNLRSAVDLARHADQEVRLGSYTSLTFEVGARIKVDPAYIPADVLQAISEALVESFSFNARSFGQAVTSSEIIAAMQGVEGVEAVILQWLHRTGGTASPETRLPSSDAHWDAAGSSILPAELLVVRPDGITLSELILSTP